MPRLRPLLIALLLSVPLLVPTAASAQWALGDTLTVIQQPLQNIPALVLPQTTFAINCEADPTTTGWQASLERGGFSIPLVVQTAQYDPQTLWWTLTAAVPEVPVFDLYDLRVSADGGVTDLARQSVSVLAAFPSDFYFVQVTDPHLPTYLYYDEAGAATDSSTTISLRHITRDVNIINPAFVLLTGDLVNEGELEDFLGRRYYSRAQQQLREFEVPVFLTSGNHDLGGWDSTPPSDGTARRDWWRFFGWKRLNNPPPGAPLYTQNYSFDYGAVHFVGLEAYINYDDWRWSIYGDESFTDGQMSWLQQDLAATDRPCKVLFHHRDFAGELDLGGLGLDMSLSGHTHRDTEDPTPPYNIITDNAGGTNRPFRLVRYSGGQLSTQPSLEAGYDGETMTVTYQPSTPGASDLVRVVINNGYAERFEYGQVRVAMPSDVSGYLVTGGTLTQVDDTAEPAICYIAVDIQASSSQVITVEADRAAAVDGELPGSVRLLSASPNPFNPRTRISFTLAEAGSCQLTIFDLEGRAVTTLVDTVLGAGEHAYNWQGKDYSGQDLPSGIYLAGLRAGSYNETRKLTLVR